ncbi:MAG: histidinol-phosphate transaminase [Candidatus Coatesbacteria bacterium]
MGKPRGFMGAGAAGVRALVRPEVYTLEPYVGGKSLDEMKRRYGRADFIKLASNENAYGPTPRARAAIVRAAGEAHRYPEGGYPALRAELARRNRLKPESVILGNGSNEVLVLAASVFLRPGEEAVMAAPSFVVYEHAVRAAGGRPVVVPLRDFRHDLPAMARAVTHRARLVFVCNPNNPTGTIVTRGEVEDFLRRLPAHVVVVFDEAYNEFVTDRAFPDTLRFVRRGLRVLVVRTLAKAWGLAGLRVGYGLGAPDVVRPLELIRQPFNVNLMAYRAACAALEDRAGVRRAVAAVVRDRERLTRALACRGLLVVPSQANFVMVRAGLGPHVNGSGASLTLALEREGVIVRPLPGRLLERWVRITVGTPPENARLLRSLDRVLYRLRRR